MDCSEALRTSWAGESSIKVSWLRSLVSYRNTPGFQYCYAQSWSGKSPEALELTCWWIQRATVGAKLGNFSHHIRRFGEHVFTATMIRIQRSVEILRVFLLSVRLFLPYLYFVLPFFSKLASSALPCHAQTRKHRSDPRLP